MKHGSRSNLLIVTVISCLDDDAKLRAMEPTSLANVASTTKTTHIISIYQHKNRVARR